MYARFRRRYKKGYFYLERFNEEKNKYEVLYVTYSNPDSTYWLHKHYPEVDYLPDYNDFLQRYMGALWFYHDDRDKDIEEAHDNGTLI